MVSAFWLLSVLPSFPPEQVQEFGVCEVRDLKPNGANILVTEENKKEYVHLVCQMRMTGTLRLKYAPLRKRSGNLVPSQHHL